MKNTVLCYLEETASKYDNKVAIVDSNSQITFGELRNRAMKLATAINKKVDGCRKPIFVYLPKSIESIVSFMGILYSGNFYTPTDVSFPFEKVNSIIKQLNPTLYISDKKNAEKLVKNGISSEDILIFEDALTENTSVTLNISDIIDTDLAYVLFTSGSTGIPKGVGITNRSIIDYIDWARECFSIDETHVFGNQAPFYFDNSVLDIYLMLSTGATLHIIPKMYYSFPVKLMQYICENKINSIFWVPSVLINVANSAILDCVDCTCLKKILFAGEVMPNKQLNYWRKKIPEALYANLYGPTEITVDCTYYIVDREFEDDESLPIGVPCRNSDIIVLDENDICITRDNPRITGELCVRGSSLAVGYWNNWDKTSESFVQNPLQSYYPEIIYRTGDLVFFNSFGEIEFAGRKDFQIKHMGYRIELGEIETAALGMDEVVNVCVLYDEKEKQIVLFYEGNTDDKKLRQYLGTVIPKYMLPKLYKKIHTFPYNDNGKIDRKRLSEII